MREEHDKHGHSNADQQDPMQHPHAIPPRDADIGKLDVVPVHAAILGTELGRT
jgi:hypothetical protein